MVAKVKAAAQKPQAWSQNKTSLQSSFLLLPILIISVYLMTTLTLILLLPVHPHHLGDRLK